MVDSAGTSISMFTSSANRSGQNCRTALTSRTDRTGKTGKTSGQVLKLEGRRVRRGEGSGKATAVCKCNILVAGAYNLQHLGTTGPTIDKEMRATGKIVHNWSYN